MRVMINQIEHQLPQGAKLENALAAIQAQAPFAVAINLQFIPKSLYGQCLQLSSLPHSHALLG